uniref:hypothetical protein n=1 Tax=Nonomuraea sediminis TaxID=2835864 RepID=UPI001BDD0551
MIAAASQGVDVTESGRDLLGSDSVGAIADIARSTRDAERAFAAAGIKLEKQPVTQYEGTVIVATPRTCAVTALSRGGHVYAGGVTLVWVTGNSGTGKSTVCGVL